LHENDVKSLLKFRELREKEFEKDLARGMKVSASDSRGKAFGPANINDGDPETYWAASDRYRTAGLTIDLGSETEINRIILQEYIKLGQRISEFKVAAFINGEWEQLTDGTTIGHKVIRKFPVVKASKIKVTVGSSKACPVVSNIELYRAPGN
jgi:alpha-L-fucosidase